MASMEELTKVIEHRSSMFGSNSSKEAYRLLSAEVGSCITYFEKLASIRQSEYEFPALQLSLEMLFEGVVQLGTELPRLAFYSLRSFAELFGFSVLISVDHLKGRLWMVNMTDLHWAEISDAEKGVLGHQFVSGMSSKKVSFDQEQLQLLKSSYRKCSEYVHSNPITWHGRPFQDILDEWSNQFRQITSSLAFAYVVANWNKAIDGDLLESLRVMLRDAGGSAAYQRALKERVDE